MMERLWDDDFFDINTKKMDQVGCWRTYCDLCCKSLMKRVRRASWRVIGQPLKGPFWPFSVKLITHSRGRNLEWEMFLAMLIQGKIWLWDPLHSYMATFGMQFQRPCVILLFLHLLMPKFNFQNFNLKIIFKNSNFQNSNFQNSNFQV